MIEGLQISIPQRMLLVRTTLVLSLIISMLLSINLWGGERHFPMTSIVEVEQIKPPYDFIYLSAVILFLSASLILKKQRLLLFLSFAVCVWLVLLDISRLQPWFYFYNAMLVVYLFYNGRVDDPNKYTSFFIILQIIAASVYFFCGLSQLNGSFVNEQFANIIQPLKKLISERQFQLFIKMGVTVPYILMFIGLGFIISPVRYLAIALAAIMHFFLLIFLFPSDLHSNHALWLSNLSFIIIGFLLFSGKTKQRYFSPTFLFQQPLFYLVIVLFVLMPFFNQRDIWPDFLSFNFRSGANKTALITLEPGAFFGLPAYEKQFYTLQKGRYVLDYDRWCATELHSDCFPDERVFNRIYGHLKYLNRGGVKEIELKYLPTSGLLRKP